MVSFFFRRALFSPRSLSTAAAAATWGSTGVALAFCEAPATRSSTRDQPVFTAEEVAEHNGKDRPESWVSYQGKVYDITDFLEDLPGGSYIYQAVGGPLEPFWSYWSYHFALARPMEFLERYEIGRLAKEEEDEEDSLEELRRDCYSMDPDREKSKADGQVELLKQPWCSETKPEKLTILTQPWCIDSEPAKLTSLYTSNEAFYVRNHAPVPVLEATDHEVLIQSEIPGHKAAAQVLSLQQLADKYPVVTIPSIMQCAGNRAAELMAVAPTAFQGTPYATIGVGMIGNATWKGVRLSQVLLDLFPFLAELSQDELESYHVEFEGADEYRTSTPLSRILDPTFDCLLAFEMNGKPIPPDHGYPLRVVLPGVAGARNVKWVQKIRLQTTECDSCFQKTYYLDPHGKAIQQMPMQSFLVYKQPSRRNESVVYSWKVRGVAWGGGSGAGVSKIQLSTDGGETWKDVPANELQQTPRQDASREWSWIVFDTCLKSPTPKKEPTILCRIFDGNGVQQPQQLWYPKGYLSNGWHQL